MDTLIIIWNMRLHNLPALRIKQYLLIASVHPARPSRLQEDSKTREVQSTPYITRLITDIYQLRKTHKFQIQPDLKQLEVD